MAKRSDGSWDNRHSGLFTFNPDGTIKAWLKDEDEAEYECHATYDNTLKKVTFQMVTEDGEEAGTGEYVATPGGVRICGKGWIKWEGEADRRIILVQPKRLIDDSVAHGVFSPTKQFANAPF